MISEFIQRTKQAKKIKFREEEQSVKVLFHETLKRGFELSGSAADGERPPDRRKVERGNVQTCDEGGVTE